MARSFRSASDTLKEAVRTFFRRFGAPVGRLTVAVSGGADSTALLWTLACLPDRGFILDAAHVNHHLRGEESDEDTASVISLCRALEVPLVVIDGTLDEGRVRVRGVEAAARELRYDRLRALRGNDLAHWIATAHQVDDQAETLLLRLVTGRGPWRLAGIRPVHDGVVRPLLHVTRATIEASLVENGLAARRDSSNESRRFLRNRIRHEVLPLLREMNPKVVEHLGETAELEQEREALLASVIATWSGAFERTESLSSIRLDRLPAEPLVRRMLLRAELRRLDPDERYVDAPSLRRIDELVLHPGRIRPSRRVEIVSDSTSISIRTVSGLATIDSYEYKLIPGGSVEIPSAGWRVSAGSFHLPDGAPPLHTQELALPREKAGASLVVRNRRRGDRFKPLGMREEKKLSDFFIDRKIPKGIRDALPLVLIDGRIAWIAGTEVSDDFRLGRGDAERLVLCAWRLGDDR